MDSAALDLLRLWEVYDFCSYQQKKQSQPSLSLRSTFISGYLMYSSHLCCYSVKKLVMNNRVPLHTILPMIKNGNYRHVAMPDITNDDLLLLCKYCTHMKILHLTKAKASSREVWVQVKQRMPRLDHVIFESPFPQKQLCEELPNILAGATVSFVQ